MYQERERLPHKGMEIFHVEELKRLLLIEPANITPDRPQFLIPSGKKNGDGLGAGVFKGNVRDAGRDFVQPGQVPAGGVYIRLAVQIAFPSGKIMF